MMDYKVKIGLAPMRRNVTARPSGSPFAWDAAEKRGDEIVSYIEKNFTNENVEFINTVGLGCNNLMFDDATAKEFLDHFKANDVDAVFIINCNFGNEEIAADLAKALGKPVLLWAPLDTEYTPEGVRTTQHSSDILVSAGWGAKDDLEAVKTFANNLQADLAASRKAVDNGILPYPLQVGLTGKTVGVPVYIAFGISGAVHHIVGMQQSGTVIAVNPDRDAPIFDYADYGIVADCETVLNQQKG